MESNLNLVKDTFKESVDDPDVFEKEFMKYLKEQGVELDNEISEEVIGFGEVLPKGNYVLVNDILNKEEEELSAKKGDKVIAFADEAPIDTVLGHQLIKRFSIIEGDPESAKVEFHQIYEIEKKNLNICIKTNTFFGCTKSRWILKQDLKAYENKKIIYSKTWSKKILRVFM